MSLFSAQCNNQRNQRRIISHLAHEQWMSLYAPLLNWSARRTSEKASPPMSTISTSLVISSTACSPSAEELFSLSALILSYLTAASLWKTGRYKVQSTRPNYRKRSNDTTGFHCPVSLQSAVKPLTPLHGRLGQEFQSESENYLFLIKWIVDCPPDVTP